MIKRNYLIRGGEIDIIAEGEGRVVFIEVKSRGGGAYGTPRESVGRLKQQRVKKAAVFYLCRTGKYKADCRFDVIEVDLNSGGVNHIKNAFM